MVTFGSVADSPSPSSLAAVAIAPSPSPLAAAAPPHQRSDSSPLSLSGGSGGEDELKRSDGDSSDGSTQARKRRRTMSEGTGEGKQQQARLIHTKHGHTSKTAPASAIPRETKGTWIPAAVFIFLSHVLVFAYFALYVWSKISSAPASALYAPSWPLIGLTLLAAWLNLLGITAGYHRLWSHASYKASFGLKVFLAIIGLCSFQGSARWWVQKHRLHHRFTDTDSDPYDSRRGLWFSHIGWLFQAPPYFEKQRLISMKDLDEDAVVRFQKRYLLWGYLLFGGVVPGLIGLQVDGSFWMGVLWIGFIGRFISWHGIWTINSLSHWHGIREFSTASSAVYVALVNLIQNGEGHHNYHHAFPKDYRHGHRWYEWDPTKWCINVWFMLGLASELETVDTNEVLQSQAQVLAEAADATRALARWGPSDDELPRMSMAEFEELAKEVKGEKIIMKYKSSILDLTKFAPSHVGGESYLRAYHGRDCTAAFEGGINLHTKAAGNLAMMYRIARVDE